MIGPIESFESGEARLFAAALQVHSLTRLLGAASCWDAAGCTKDLIAMHGLRAITDEVAAPAVMEDGSLLQVATLLVDGDPQRRGELTIESDLRTGALTGIGVNLDPAQKGNYFLDARNLRLYDRGRNPARRVGTFRGRMLLGLMQGLQIARPRPGKIA
jgi:hypothetical protein